MQKPMWLSSMFKSTVKHFLQRKRSSGIKLFIYVTLNQSHKASQRPHCGAIDENYVEREQWKTPTNYLVKTNRRLRESQPE